MTKDEALQMCLEYIETNAHERKYVRHAIKEALAQQEAEAHLQAVSDFGQLQAQIEQKPVMEYDKEELRGTFWDTTPPKRKEWVGLTEKASELVYEDVSGQSLRPQDYRLVLQFAVAVEAKLKELNT